MPAFNNMPALVQSMQRRQGMKMGFSTRYGHLLKIIQVTKLPPAELLNICEINQRFIYKMASIR